MVLIVVVSCLCGCAQIDMLFGQIVYLHGSLEDTNELLVCVNVCESVCECLCGCEWIFVGLGAVGGFAIPYVCSFVNECL